MGTAYFEGCSALNLVIIRHCLSSDEHPKDVWCKSGSWLVPKQKCRSAHNVAFQNLVEQESVNGIPHYRLLSLFFLVNPQTV
jgi:hypothetical protein